LITIGNHRPEFETEERLAVMANAPVAVKNIAAVA
jgi:hypothetical protein